MIISAVDHVNDNLSFMICFHPYYIQERPVRSIIIINIIVIVVVIIIYYCLTGQYHSAKKGLVQLAVLCSWHYQNKSKFFFLVTTTLLSLPPPLPQTLHTETVQFYPWSKFYFLLFQTHYHTLPYPKTYLPWQQPASAVDSADSLFLTSPSPLSPTVNSLNNPITGWRINRVNKILALLCAVH